MTTTLRLTERDREIVQCLVQKVRLLSQRQLAHHWWEGDLANMRRRMNQLVDQGLVTRITVQARPLPELQQPLASWRVGDAPPDFGQVAFRCQDRWRQRAIRSCACWIATDKAAQVYGGVRRGELKQPTQATHDLGVAAVWLRLRAAAPEWADAWRSEDLLAHTRHDEKLPDAFIVGDGEQPFWVIEFGGGYNAERVAAFHHDCARRGLPYQLW
ncbi:MAG: hypothetical protein JNM18_07240 [Planctomycetaceae bacterium]|nr:hypothetical protein [Planctomycetaceae bacterium]